MVAIQGNVAMRQNHTGTGRMLYMELPIEWKHAKICEFMEAFDTAPHKRLVNKTQKYGIKQNISGWIESFLSDCTQFVVNMNFPLLGPGPGFSSGIPKEACWDQYCLSYMLMNARSPTQR